MRRKAGGGRDVKKHEYSEMGGRRGRASYMNRQSSVINFLKNLQMKDILLRNLASLYITADIVIPPPSCC